jgi:mycothiol synthase
MSARKREPKEMERSQPEIAIRHPVAEDIQQTFDLLMRCKIPEYGLDGLREEWGEMDLTQQAWLALDGEDSLVGYATATPHRVGLCYHVYVDPTWEGTAVNRMLLQQCDRWGSMQVPARTQPGEDIVTTWIASGSERDERAVAQAGFWLVRRTLLMCVEMQQCPPEPQWPVGIKVRSAVPGQDDRAICRLMAAAFAGTHLEPTTFEGWRNAMIGGAYFDADLWFVALRGQEIIGACLCAVYPEAQEAWLRQLAVATKWQRRGVGRALVVHAFREFYRRGHKAVRVGVEACTAAHRLYEQVGMRRVRQYDEYQKRIAYAG